MRIVGVTVASGMYNSGKTDYSFPPPTTGYTQNSSDFGITLSPNMGWFISDNVAVGATFLLSYNESKNADVGEASGNTFNKDNSSSFNIGMGGFVRNYFNTSGKVLPFGQFNLNFGTGSSTSKGFYFTGSDKFTYDGKSSGDFFVNTGLVLGFTKMLNPNTGLDLFAGYNYSYNNSTFKKNTIVDVGNDGTPDQTLVNEPSQKYTNHGACIGVSFQIFLDKKKK